MVSFLVKTEGEKCPMRIISVACKIVQKHENKGACSRPFNRGLSNAAFGPVDVAHILGRAAAFPAGRRRDKNLSLESETPGKRRAVPFSSGRERNE